MLRKLLRITELKAELPEGVRKALSDHDMADIHDAIDHLNDEIAKRDKEIKRLLEEGERMRYCLELIATRDGLPPDDFETIAVRSVELAAKTLDTLT